jgi:Ca-activated chloride channel family protein
VGESNVEKIIQNAKETKVEGLRLFTFGVGYDVNTRLLDKLASENGGVADYIEPKEDIEIKVSNFFTKVNSPVLTDLEMDFAGLQTDLMYPRDLPDIFKGSQLTIIGRYKNQGDLDNLTFRLKGKTGKEMRTFNYSDLDFPMRAESNDFLPRLWATRRVGWLVEQIRSNGENKELRDEIVDLGTRFGIVTPYTSYLATDGSERNMTPMAAQRAARDMPMAVDKVARSESGAGAVTLSKDAKKMKEEVRIDGSDDEVLKTGLVKKAGIKTFYFENGIWMDSEFKEEAKMTEVRLSFASDAYFDLVTRERQLAQFFAVGEQVVVVWKGKVYRVTK